MPAFVNQQEGDGQENLSSCIWKTFGKSRQSFAHFPSNGCCGGEDAGIELSYHVCVEPNALAAIANMQIDLI